jgi:hypothetical protein
MTFKVVSTLIFLVPLTQKTETTETNFSFYQRYLSALRLRAKGRWLPTAAEQVHVWAEHVRTKWPGAGFLRVLWFPLPIIIPPISPPSQSPRVGTIGLLVAAVPSGSNWTPLPTVYIYTYIKGLKVMA